MIALRKCSCLVCFCYGIQSLSHIRSFSSSMQYASKAALVTKLIQSHCRIGRTDVAQKVFDEFPEKNVILYSTMIYGYSSNGLFVESVDLFSRMWEFGIGPNSFTFVAVLLSVCGMQSLRLAECLHGLIVKVGLEDNAHVRTALLDAYGSCGSTKVSNSLFAEMTKWNLVTCNAMVTVFLQSNLFEEAILLFKQVCSVGLMPNCITLLCMSQSCVGYGSFKLCESLHGYIVKIGFDGDISVKNSVLEMYMTSGDVKIACDFFKKMVHKDVISWTTMMGFLVEHEHAQEALQIFHHMRAYGSDPDMVTIIHLITSCAFVGALRKGRSVHSHVIVAGLESVLRIKNSLISMYSKCGDMASARWLFDHKDDRTLVSWTALISGYVQNRRHQEVLRLLVKMRTEKLNLDSTIVSCLLAACTELGGLGLSKLLHSYSLRSGFLLFTTLQNSLVAAYGKCGRVDLAERAFREMSNCNRVSCNVMISAYGMNGEIEAALRFFYDMGKYGQEPDSITYLNILSACNHAGNVEDGLAIFSRMAKEKKVEPSGEHFGCLVDMLSRAGRLEDARKVADLMRNEDSEKVWRALLGGCLIHSEKQLAETATDKVLQTNSLESGHIVLLSNIYASLGQFEDVKTLRSHLGAKGQKKNLGVSLLGHDVGYYSPCY